MKTYLHTLITGLALLFLGAQDLYAADTTKAPLDTYHENSIGVHLGLGYNAIFSKSKSPDLYPYRVTYRRFFGENALRIGAGLRFGNSNSIFNSDSESNTQEGFYAFRIGLGYERYHKFSERFQLYYGGEINNFYRRDKSFESSLDGNVTEWNHDYQIGIAPLIGLEVKLTSKLSISTEALLNFGFQAERNKTTTTGVDGPQTSQSRSNRQFTDFEFPRGLTLRYNF